MRTLFAALIAVAMTATLTFAGECKEYIELHSAAEVAKEYGRSESWVVANHKINLWQHPASKGYRGKAVGKLRPGSRALILEHAKDSYKVQSPLDNSRGWLSDVQVSHTLWQDVKTFEACTANGSSVHDGR